MEERHIRIIELVSIHKKIEVSKLAELLHTSQVTVRKDLDVLADKGILKRERGYAVLNAEDDINYRMAFHYEIKRKIALSAAKLVQDGETVMIESGSACMLLAELLAYEKRGVTIITNSAYLASYVKDAPGVKVTLLGGDYQPRAQAMVGPLTKMCAQQFCVDKIFVGTDGFSETNGFTGDNLVRADTVRAMAESAHRTVVLADAEKFTRAGTVSFLKPSEVSVVITDSGIPGEIREYLTGAGVQVLTVE
ncbi:DeoR/GlpR family DNA-binding transcription regulator [Diplocloster agilis]|uniref:Lactose phosphotransferase system repressor n=1 Tax=Diplocloster agilis TaxID=2850323 RepID=A0A949K484_9FIRM|nr:DeoR/GlpR family DNA-binding transcription regulator [Diplocloster agilis]MBU9735163.1 DeoR/GlpR family DNA-binding transcription regulator [Diplocloster agilis]MBU9744158.1 DeoR/GlpR family DNA-binding transcription regulator [Diplocloster agilis]